MPAFVSLSITDRESGVAVGIVTNQHTSPTTGDFLYDIRFCSPKGAKLAAKNRTDTLYQNMNATGAFKFNLHYNSKVRKKVMLAFHSHINMLQRGWKIFEKRLFTNIYSMSSYSLADNVIRGLYGN